MTLSAAEELEAMKAHDLDAPPPPREALGSGTDQDADSPPSSQASTGSRTSTTTVIEGDERKRRFGNLTLCPDLEDAEDDLRHEQRRKRRRRTNNSKVEEEEG